MRSTTMNFTPIAAIAMTGAILVVIGLCLALMVWSRRPDARLQFLLNLMQTLPACGDQSETPQSPGARQDPLEGTTVGAARCAGLGDPSCARLASRETRLLFAAALRGRGL
jgi:hypothetical protein